MIFWVFVVVYLRQRARGKGIDEHASAIINKEKTDILYIYQYGEFLVCEKSIEAIQGITCYPEHPDLVHTSFSGLLCNPTLRLRSLLYRIFACKCF